MNKKLLVFGTGEIGELAHFYFTHDTSLEVHGFICDDSYFQEDTFLNLPCIRLSDIHQFPPEHYGVHVALSYKKLNKIREEKYNFFKNLGYGMPSYISSKSTVWSTDIGDNCFILEDQTIQPNVRIGNNVMLWSGNHIGHGTIIEDHVYIASHAVISGHCKIGKRTFIGVNVALKDFITIGEDCFLGMGANVTQDCESESIVLAARSTILPSDDILAKKLKESYFGN